MYKKIPLAVIAALVMNCASTDRELDLAKDVRTYEDNVSNTARVVSGSELEKHIGRYILIEGLRDKPYVFINKKGRLSSQRNLLVVYDEKKKAKKVKKFLEKEKGRGLDYSVVKIDGEIIQKYVMLPAVEEIVNNYYFVVRSNGNIVVKNCRARGEYPEYRVEGNKIICVNYKGKDRTINEFINFLERLKPKIKRCK